MTLSQMAALDGRVRGPKVCNEEPHGESGLCNDERPRDKVNNPGFPGPCECGHRPTPDDHQAPDGEEDTRWDDGLIRS